MDLLKVILETADVAITIQRNRSSRSWYFQVIKGLNVHVESKDFSTCEEAICYAREKYGLVEE